MRFKILFCLCVGLCVESQATSLALANGLGTLQSSRAYQTSKKTTLFDCVKNCYDSVASRYVLYNANTRDCSLFATNQKLPFNDAKMPPANTYAYVKSPTTACSPKPALQIPMMNIGRLFQYATLSHRFMPSRKDTIRLFVSEKSDFCYLTKNIPECNLRPFGSEDGGKSLTLIDLAPSELYGYCAVEKGACKAFQEVHEWSPNGGVLKDKVYAIEKEQFFDTLKYKQQKQFCWFWSGDGCPKGPFAVGEQPFQLY